MVGEGGSVGMGAVGVEGIMQLRRFGWIRWDTDRSLKSSIIRDICTY